MIKDNYIIFSKDVQGAVIRINPPSEMLDEHRRRGDVILKNPHREDLHGVPPHLWSYDKKNNQVFSSTKGTALRHMWEFKHNVRKREFLQQILVVTVIVEVIQGLIHLLH